MVASVDIADPADIAGHNRTNTLNLALSAAVSQENGAPNLSAKKIKNEFPTGSICVVNAEISFQPG
jgi:hypothetical protein